MHTILYLTSRLEALALCYRPSTFLCVLTYPIQKLIPHVFDLQLSFLELIITGMALSLHLLLWLAATIKCDS